MPVESEIIVENLTKRYGTHTAIDRLSFQLHSGERLAVFAPSGAGKTTLLLILAGLEKPDGGTCRVTPDATIVFQEPRLFPFLTVEENILLPFKVRKQILTAAIREAYKDWMAICELEAFTHHYPYQLSGGMKHKTALVRALLGEPRLLLLDEPFQSIGIEARHRLIAHIKETRPDLTLLLVTHNPDVVTQLAQSVLYFDQSCLSNGTLIPLLTPDDPQRADISNEEKPESFLWNGLHHTFLSCH
jgi:ABC-type nitrate/sulfonate/bicarbonate transport system ATPase subunit